MKQLLPSETIEQKIFLLRGHKVMLSPHLAELYGVETRILVQAVKRNIKRFPVDFMFQLTHQEFENLKSQIVISSWGGSRRARPYAFTEHGAVMLASILNSPIAVQSSIMVVRVFVRLREIMATHKYLARKIDDMEKKYDAQFKVVFEAIRRLLTLPEKPKERIGFYKK
jgi:hypothetical protein